MQHLGYKPVDVAWMVSEALQRAIKTDAALVKESQERLREAQVVPDASLGARQLAHLNLARKIAARVFIYTPVAGVHAVLIPPASDRTRTAGLYSRTTDEVLISPEQLERASTIVDTLIHELAHHQSEAEDLTEAHAQAMTWVGSRVVELTTKGEFDAELREAVW